MMVHITQRKNTTEEEDKRSHKFMKKMRKLLLIILVTSTVSQCRVKVMIIIFIISKKNVSKYKPYNRQTNLQLFTIKRTNVTMSNVSNFMI